MRCLCTYKAFDESGASTRYSPSHKQGTTLWVFHYYAPVASPSAHSDSILAPILATKDRNHPPKAVKVNQPSAVTISKCQGQPSLLGETLSWVHSEHAPMFARPRRLRQACVALSLAKHVQGWLAAVHQWAPKIAQAYRHQEWEVLLTANHKVSNRKTNFCIR
jgi:hypothetical protein